MAVCGDMTRTKEQKKQLDLFLKDEQVLQNLPSAIERIPMLLAVKEANEKLKACLLYTSPSPRDIMRSRMPSSA